MSHNRGYTAIELMLVMAVVAITSSLAVANHASKLPQTNLRGAGRDIVGELRRARQEAIRTRQTVVVCFPASTDAACNDNNIPERNYEVSKLRDSSARVQKSLPKHVSFGASEWVSTPGGGIPPDSGVSFFGESAAFTSKGRPSGGTGTIYLTNASASGSPGSTALFDQNIAISVNIAGRVKLQTCKKVLNETETEYQCDWQ